MLILTRKPSFDPASETAVLELRVGDTLILIHVLAVESYTAVKIGIDAPKDVIVSRPEAVTRARLAAAPKPGLLR